MPFVVAILAIVACVFLFWGASYLFDHASSFLPGICCCIVAMIMALIVIVTVCNAFAYGEYIANADAYNAQAIEERAVNVTMLDEITHLIEQDVTASDTYMTIYDNVMDFNRQVNKANKWGGTWAEGIFCDPRYKGLEVIPLN